MKLKLIANNNLISNAERKTIDGIEHLVVPVVAIREGVLNGVFYHSEEISTFAEAWNGVPVPVDHPKKNGKHISANSVEVEETTNIGKLYNVTFNESNKSLDGEIWINIEKADRLGFSDLIAHLENGGEMEVSTGLFSHAEESSGVYDGEEYTLQAFGIRPDHLALLPDTIGACSIEDGCGVQTNEEDKKSSCSGKCGCGGKCKKKTYTNKREGFFNRMIKKLFTANEKSHSDVRSMLSATLRETYGDEPWPYILDVYNNYVVYELGTDYFKQSYAIDENKAEATLLGESVQVKVETVYTPLTTNNKMNQQERQKLLDGIFAANADLSDEQKAAYKGLPDDALSQLATNTQKPSSKGAGEEVVPAQEPTVNSGGLNDEERALLNRLKANEENRLYTLRKNVSESFGIADEVVANMDETALQAFADKVAPQGQPNTVNFAAAAGSAPVTANEGEYVPPAIFLANDEQKGETK